MTFEDEFVDISIASADSANLQKLANGQWTVSFILSSEPPSEWNRIFLADWKQQQQQYGHESDLFYFPQIMVAQSKIDAIVDYDAFLAKADLLFSTLNETAERTNGSYRDKQERQSRTEEDERRNIQQALKKLSFD